MKDEKQPYTDQQVNDILAELKTKIEDRPQKQSTPPPAVKNEPAPEGEPAAKEEPAAEEKGPPLAQDAIYHIFDKVKEERKAAIEAALQQQEQPPAPAQSEPPDGLSPEGEGGAFTDTSQFHINVAAAREASRVMNLQEKMDDDFRSFFSETVAVSRSEIDTAYKNKKQKAEKMAKVVQLQVEADTQPEEVFISAPVAEKQQEYETPEDAPAIRTELKNLKASLVMRLVISGLMALLLLYTGLAQSFALPVPSLLMAKSSSFYYLLWNGALLLISGIVSAAVLLGGVAGLFRQPTADTLTAFSVIGALVQCVYFIISGTFSTAAVTLFAPVAALALFFNALGKLLSADTILKNFEMVSQTYEGAAALPMEEKDLAGRLAKGLLEETPSLLYSRPAGFVKGFMQTSFSERASDKKARLCAFITLGCAVCCFGLSYFTAKDLGGALSCFAASLVLGGCFSASFVAALPSRLLYNAASRVGAVVPGWGAIEKLRDTNVVHVEDKDLFPAGTVMLHGIKTFEKERIDLAILYAASICVEGSPTLRDIFLTVIENKTDILYPVENLQYENGCGFVAWLQHNRVLLGNRELMRRHDVEIPSLDYEKKYTKNGQRQPLYLAVAGKVFALFVVSYHPDENMAETLYELERQGIAVAVSGRDFCITSELLSEVYEIPQSYIKVLSGEEQDELAPFLVYREESEGSMTHLGTFPSFIGGLQAALACAAGEKSASYVQLAGVLLAQLLALLLAFTSGLPRLSLLAVISYLCAWFILSAAIPLAKKY